MKKNNFNICLNCHYYPFYLYVKRKYDKNKEKWFIVFTGAKYCHLTYDELMDSETIIEKLYNFPTHVEFNEDFLKNYVELDKLTITSEENCPFYFEHKILDN